MASKMETILAKYGRIGIIVYFSIFFLTLFGFWTLLTAGVDIRTWSFFSSLGDVGAIGLAYAATKLTQPIRIALTLVCTPLIDRFFPANVNQQDEDSGR
jgi:hypothetical protein